MVDVAFSFTGVHEFARGMRTAPAAMNREVRSATDESLKEFESTLLTERMRGRPGVFVREGTLRRSVKRTLSGNSIATLVGRVVVGGPAANYAVVQEEGATLRARRGNFLAIPTGRALTKGGRVGSIGGESFTSPRNFAGRTFLRPRAGGGWTVFLRISRTVVRPIFILVRQVVVPPRLGFALVWRALEAQRVLRFRNAIARALAGAGGR